MGIKRPSVQVLATFLASLNVVSCGMHYAWSSQSLLQLQSTESDIEITNEEGSTIVVALLIGEVVGSVLTRLIIDRIGRKGIIITATIPGITSWMLIAFATSASELIAARCIAGLHTAMTYSATCMFIAEIAKSKYRGSLGSLIGIGYILGNLLINIIGSQLSIKYTAVVCSALPITVLMLFPWMPESPYYLLTKKNVEKAKRSLKLYHGKNNYEESLERIQHALEEQNAKPASWLDLVKIKSNRKALLLMIGLEFIRQTSGFTPIVFYTTTLFENSSNLLPASLAAIILIGVKLTFSTISSLLVDRFGRKLLLGLSIGGTGIASLVIATYNYLQHYQGFDSEKTSPVPIIALIFFVIMFSSGIQTVPYIMAGELFPTNVKANALTVTNIWLCVGATMVSEYFQITKDVFGLEVPFFTFAVCCTLGVLFTIFILPETKGKTLEEIQSELKK